MSQIASRTCMLFVLHTLHMKIASFVDCAPFVVQRTLSECSQQKYHSGIRGARLSPHKRHCGVCGELYFPAEICSGMSGQKNVLKRPKHKTDLIKSPEGTLIVFLWREGNLALECTMSLSSLLETWSLRAVYTCYVYLTFNHGFLWHQVIFQHF